MPKQPAVYIFASKRNGTLYVGVTGDLQQRAWTHKNDVVEGFTNNKASAYWFVTSYMAIWPLP